MNARCGQRDAGPCSPYRIYRCRELLDKLEVGVDVSHAGLERSLHLRQAAAQRGELRFTSALRSDVPAGSVAVDLDRPFHVHGRFRALARKQLHRLAADAVQLAHRDDDVALQMRL
ncbi:hypothetical protein D3C78_1352850 [compost metagenome]